MAYEGPGGSVPSLYGALGPPRGAMGGLGQAARPQQPTHAKVPIATLIALLLAEAPKAVTPRRSSAAGLLGGQRTQGPLGMVGGAPARRPSLRIGGIARSLGPTGGFSL